MLVHRLLVVLVLAVSALTAAADVTVTRLSGPTTFTVNELTNVGSASDPVWRVKMTATVGSTPMVLAVRADGSNDAIEYVRVEVNDPSPQVGGRVELRVEREDTGDRLVRVNEVKRVSDDATPDGELWIRLIETDLTAGSADGNISPARTTRGGLIQADRIVQVAAAGHVTGSPPVGERAYYLIVGTGS